MDEKSRAIKTHVQGGSVPGGQLRRTAEDCAAYLLPRLTSGTSVLDIGCGPGSVTADLAERVAPGSVLAVDLFDGVVDMARAEVRRRNLSNVSFATADVHNLGLPDDAFDVVHAHQVLQHVADPVRALREMGRVCRPGGVVAARDVDYAGFIWFPQLPALDLWRDLYRQAARANRGEPDAGRRLLSWARAAGFDDVTATASVWCYATAATREWWGRMWADRILHSGVGRELLALGLATTAQLEEIAVAWRTWAAAPDGWLSIPHGEILCRV
jgi:ubiquinone/menaquinone biosynthesis C-methylase UbiE